MLDIFFGSAGEWVKENAGLVGDFLAWRWSSPTVLVVSLIVYVIIVARWNQVLDFVAARMPNGRPTTNDDVSVLAGRSLEIVLMGYSHHESSIIDDDGNTVSSPTVTSVETSLRPSHPMELSRVILLVQAGRDEPLEVDEVRHEKRYLDSPFPLVLDRPGIHKWSFELPTKRSESSSCKANLALLVDGQWQHSKEIEVPLEADG